MARPTAYHDLVYASRSARNRLDLYIPAAPERCPLIVWVHGGAWMTGDKTDGAPVDVVERGYALASVNYRLSDEALFPAQIHDVKAAVRWLRAHADLYRIDATRVGAWGPSAGGHLVALLGTAAGVGALEDASMGNAGYSSAVQAVVDWFGPTDFLQMDAQALPGTAFAHDAPDSPESRLVGCAIQRCPGKAAQANPITYVRGGLPPFYIQHGAEDRVVPPGQSRLLHDALTSAGASSTLELLAENGHGGGAFDSPERLLGVIAFFDRYLKS